MSQSEAKRDVFASLDGRDFLQIKWTEDGKRIFKFVGCEDLAKKLSGLRSGFGENPEAWPMCKNSDHTDLLINEFLLKLKNQWQVVFPHDEICHCRFVSTHMVEQAILAGAHTTEKVSRWTSASTACGTCRPDVQAIIDQRLKSS